MQAQTGQKLVGEADRVVRNPPGLQLYLAQRDVGEVLPGLAAAVPPAPPFTGLAERVHQRSIWLGAGGTRTPLHRDPYENIFCQVSSSHPCAACTCFSTTRVITGAGTCQTTAACVCHRSGATRV